MADLGMMGDADQLLIGDPDRLGGIRCDCHPSAWQRQKADDSTGPAQLMIE
jgi:hypothetical protein